MLLFFIIPKYNIIFSESQTSLVLSTRSFYHFLYILISLIDRRAWLERGGGVTYPISLYHPFPLPFVTYTYIPISLYLDIRIPYSICLTVGHTCYLITSCFPYLFPLPVLPTCSSLLDIHLFSLPVFSYRYRPVSPT